MKVLSTSVTQGSIFFFINSYPRPTESNSFLLQKCILILPLSRRSQCCIALEYELSAQDHFKNYFQFVIFISINTDKNEGTGDLDIYIYNIVWPLGSVVTLSSDQAVPGSIPCSAMRFFSSGELFHVYTNWLSQYRFSMFCPCRWKRPLHSANHRSGEALQLCACSNVWSIESS